MPVAHLSLSFGLAGYANGLWQTAWANYQALERGLKMGSIAFDAGQTVDILGLGKHFFAITTWISSMVRETWH